jgi:uncharacterized protein with NRDE domain
MKKQKKKIISFVNIKEVRQRNQNNLKKIVNIVTDFLKNKGLEFDRYIDSLDKTSMNFSVYLKDKDSEYGFRFTVFHEEGLEIDSVHYKNNLLLPSNCTKNRIITANAKGEIIYAVKFDDDAIQKLLDMILVDCKMLDMKIK